MSGVTVLTNTLSDVDIRVSGSDITAEIDAAVEVCIEKANIRVSDITVEYPDEVRALKSVAFSNDVSSFSVTLLDEEQFDNLMHYLDALGQEISL